ncbi:MAG: SpaA isopeptide-forming pilin-related protein [Protaetiibacter sp.]
MVEFTTYQYGNDSAGADGIGFFLTDGAYELTATGGMGGALGYAYRTSTSWPTEQGAAHGYLGVGLDVYGNFVNPSHTAPECGGSGTSPITQSVGLRGPGNGRTGYCLVAQNRVSSTISKTLDKPSAAISGSGASYDNAVRAALDAAKRNVRVTVWPLENGATNPRVTVEIQFPGENYYRTVIDATMDSPSPSLIKFGFMAATGGSKQAHLLDAVRVGTVLQMKELNITKVVDYAANASPTKTTFDVGDVVHYKFVVHNATQAASGISTIYNILVTDPLIPSISCPSTQLARLASMECTGSLTVTAANRDAGRIRNTATVAGSISSDPNAPRNLTDKASVEVPVNPFAPDETRVIQPGGVATFQVIKSGSTLGIVTPDDPSRLRLEVYNPNTSSWVAVPTSGVTSFAGTYGTWRIYPDNRVTFTHNNSANYTITPLQYRVTNAYGGSAQATLNVTVSVVPWSVCTPAQVRASERYWAFGTASMFDFGQTGTTLTRSALTGLASTHGSFTVTDAKGTLLFIVDSSGVIRRSDGTPMAGSPTAGTLYGASPSTVFPAGQGTGKYFVVTSSATTTAAGQLRYWMVDMTQNSGAGQVTSGPTTLGSAGVASMAVTSVPNADGTGYWVISPDKVGSQLRAYFFTSAGPTNATSPVISSVTPAAISTAGPVSYEDIRFSADLTRVATLASNASASSTALRTRVRLLTFNAASGAFSAAGTTYTRDAGATNQIGYSLEFSPDGSRLYFSTYATSGSNFAVRRATITASGSTLSLGAYADVTTGASSGGAVRAGADGRLYWARNGFVSSGTPSVQYLASPNGTGTTWSTQNLAAGAASTYGLSNTLSDCAIPPAEFFLEKYNGNGVLTSGATFALYPDAGGSAGTVAVSPGIVSTGTGTYKASGIAPGSYWIRETTTLTGHSLLPQDILIVVTLGGAIQLDAVPNPQVQLVNASGVYTLKITNDAALSLPLVGGPGTAWLLGSGVVLVLVAVLGAWWWRRRRDRRT